MAEKKVANVIKLQIPAGAANPAPPVGPALGAAGVNIMQFCQAFNAETQDKKGDIIPVEISVYEDKSFSFITKTPPAAHLIKKELNLKSGSAKPQADKVGQLSQQQLPKIAEITLYTPLQAAKLIKELDTAKFDETVEAHFRLGIDTRKADQNIRGSISLPHGTGKTVRVAVFAEGEKAREAEAAGADIIGSDELVAQIQKGEINFDAAIATPNMMAKVGRIGKILGPRGLMPNPKLGTVTMDVAKMVSELKAGRVEYRADRYGICHVPLGKKSFSEQQLVENYAALYTEILRVKPSSAKGKYVKSISVSSTMGPGVKVDPAVQRDFLAE